MASQNFNTSTKTFRQMFGNGLVYSVPPFQRDYSWTSTQWEELWEDILATFDEGAQPYHYMGYIVFSSKDNRRFEVIDGQQRLTTLTILILALLNAIRGRFEQGIDSEKNCQRFEQLRGSYIGFLDPVTLIPQSKLTLNRSNDPFFQNYIVPLLQMPRSRLKASDKQLRESFEWFCEKVDGYFPAEKNGEELARFIESISDRLIFTVIEVDDDLNAFTVFETLNSRGVRLSPTDLLKNYLFSVVSNDNPHSTEMATLEQRWDEITGKIAEYNFTDFLRVHWNSKNSRVRESGLFKAIRKQVSSKAQVFALIRDLDADAAVFAALSQPENELWNAEQAGYLRELKLFQVRQPWPMLLAAHRLFDSADFTKLLHACTVISFRYNVIGSGATGDQETVYCGLARDIFERKFNNARGVLLALKPVYKDDVEFRGSFARKSFKTSQRNNKAIALHILAKIESLVGPSLDPASAKYNMEHILPVNPGENWPQFSPEEADDMVYRLGNLAILEKSLNTDAANKDFAAKLAVYLRSDIITTRQIAENNTEWDTGRIDQRQKEMARLATSIWRLSEFD